MNFKLMSLLILAGLCVNFRIEGMRITPEGLVIERVSTNLMNADVNERNRILADWEEALKAVDLNKRKRFGIEMKWGVERADRMIRAFAYHPLKAQREAQLEAQKKVFQDMLAVLETLP